MANEENLKKFTSEQNREEAVKNGKNGGIQSGKSRRRKKHIRDTVKMLMQLPLKEGKLDQLISYDTVNGKNRTVCAAITAASLCRSRRSKALTKSGIAV